MTHPALIERITRSLAYMLRHQPEEFDLELDAQGYGDAERIVQALNERLGEPVTMADLEDAIRSGDRPRYEIVGNRVRALYGHSIDVEPGEPSRPPELLFVGISARDADRATRYGLRGGRRRFLHLALSPEDAKEGGRRAGREYVVITVYALDAWEEGINFYDRKALFLAGQIPTEFLEVSESCSDGFEPELRSPGGRREFSGGRQRGGHDRSPAREPVVQREPEAASEQGYEEEGFGERTSEAIQVDRGAERGGVGASGLAGGAGEGRGDRGSHGGGRQRGGRNRSDEPRSNAGFSRVPAAGGRSPSWDDSPAGSAPDPREIRSVPRERHPEHARAEPAQERVVGEQGGDRPPREAFGEARVDARESDRGRQGDRGHSRERGERREAGPGSRDDRGPRGFDRGERGQRSDREAPAQVRPPAAPPPPRAPEVQPPARGGEAAPGFGLGIFEEPAVRPRPAPVRAVPPPTPPPAPPQREQDPSDGFGAGV